MANVITKNPLKIDTAGAGDLLAADAFVRIVKFRWIASAAVGNVVSVTDTSGHEIWRAVAAAANDTQESDFFSPPIRVRGLKVPTLAAGILYIYTEE